MNAKDDELAMAKRGADRRAFVKAAGLTGAGLGFASVLAGKMGILDGLSGARGLGLESKSVEAWNTPATTITDADILNFALNLEYLEAEFYTVATTGGTIEQAGIPVDGTGSMGPTTGGNQVAFEADGSLTESSGMLRAVAEQLAYDEQQHVLLLRAALGSAAIAKPAINLDALGFGFGEFHSFLYLARVLEDTGVSAYGGAAPLISSNTILATATQIALTEALHSGNIRLLVSENKVPIDQVDTLDVPPPPSGTNYFTVNSQALAVVRVPSQVLHIVYHSWAAGVSSGGFFPSGLNGAITTGPS